MRQAPSSVNRMQREHRCPWSLMSKVVVDASFVVQGVGCCCGSTMRGLLLFSSERSSSTVPAGGRRQLVVRRFTASSLGSCYVFFFSSQGLFCKKGCNCAVNLLKPLPRSQKKKGGGGGSAGSSPACPHRTS
jgi:hypothetical protein